MIEVTVTAEDIEQGAQADCTGCPVALAVERATGDWPHVFGNGVTLTLAHAYTALPRDVHARILAYDQGEGMEPFAFELPDIDAWTVVEDDDDEDDEDDE